MLSMEVPGRSLSRAIRGERLAALDLGTNNCRLLVAELRDEGLVVVDSFTRIVRLGAGMTASNRLTDAAMARTLSALKICARVIARNAVARVRCVATEACRRAQNGPAFIRRVEAVTGLELEILAQDEEARLAMLGCLPLVDPSAEHLLVIDIGGGSTEVFWVDRSEEPATGEPGAAVSLPLGVVTLSESFGPEIDDAVYAEMVDLVHRQLISAAQLRGMPATLPSERVQMLGTSGTVTTLAAVHLRLKRYDRRRVDGIQLPFSAIHSVSQQLRCLGNAERAAHPCIGNGRADLVIAGCAILDAVHRIWPVDRLSVADRGVREGILASLTGTSLRHVLHFNG